jgi:hypothetical protein
MAGPKGRIVRGALDALTDVFDPKTYYHASTEPSITKFDPNALDSWEDFNPGRRGATFFTSDPNYANRILEDKYGEEKINVWETDDSSLKYEEYLDELFERGEAPTVYPVRIKTDEIFNYKNKKQVEDLLKSGLDEDRHWADKEIRQFYLGPEFGYEHHHPKIKEVFDRIRKGEWGILESSRIQELMKEKGYRGYKTREPGTVGLFYPHKGDVRSIFAKFNPKKSKSGNILASVPAAALASGIFSELGDE